MPVMHRSATAQRGVSLVELMVALVIGLVLIAGVIQIYLGTKSGYRLQEAMSRVQENGRFALNFLNNDLRMAGYPGGCRGVGAEAFDVTVNVDRNGDGAADFDFTLGNIIFGNEDGAGFTAPAAVPRWGGSNSDTVAMRRAVFGNATTLAGDMAGVNAPLVVNGVAPNVGDQMVVSDCQAADIFVVTGVTGTGPLTVSHSNAQNLTGNLSRVYVTSDPVNVLRFVADTYYIGTNDNGTPGDTSDDFPSLYRTGDRGTVEMVRNVEDMQVAFGRDTSGNGQADQYDPADTVSAANAWDQVVSLQLDLLLRSDQAVLPQPQPYVFQNTTVTAADDADVSDRRLRRWISSTVALRNRL